MNIQQSINTVLGQSVIAARLNPYFEAKRELKIADAYIQAADTYANPGGAKTKGEQEADIRYIEQAAQHAERAYELKPTKENLDTAQTWREFVGETREFYEAKNEQAQVQAAESMRVAAEQKRNQQKSRELMSIISSGGQGIEDWKRKYGGEA